ncbi:MAG: zinc ribbon domain-containing protein [Anaerolineaceae bacterium]|nr:zinc ribbon domain-containing protein [Anaerolineaceae bacterium]
MSDHDRKRRLTGPYRNLEGALWLIGLAILAWQNWWWPGILVLVGISLVFEAILMAVAPHSFEEDQPTAPAANVPVPSSPTAAAVVPEQEHRAELLPLNCPNCGSPIRGHEVKWTGPQSADCPYCGTNLPMKANVSP